MNENAIIHSVPAASELHKVPGFDPMKHLHRTANAKGEPVLQMEPRYQKLWFRLACPRGRMLLNPLRITDQLAIFEAKVYFHRDDPTPASSFTSHKTAQETPGYIRAAQDEALKEALDNAGFGIQLCDVTQAPGEEGHSLPAPPVRADDNAPSVKSEAPAQTAPAQPQSVPSPAKAETATPPFQVKTAPPVVENPQPIQPVAVEPPPTERPQPAPAVKEPAPEPATVVQPAEKEEPAPAANSATVQEEPKAAPQQNDTVQADGQQSVLAAVLQFPTQAAKNAAQQTADSSAPAAATPAVAVDAVASPQAETPSQPNPGYTDDMPVEEICQMMTLEEAREVVVPKGPCVGWTMAQVAERRPSSLRFYLTPFSGCSNIQKAAATLLIQDREQKKAG